MFKILKELTKHKSENPPCDCRAILDYVHTFLSKNTRGRVFYQKVGRTKGNVIAIFGEPTMLIHAHLDTVPASPSWTRDPFTLTRSRNKVYGLGSTDVKGAIATILYNAAKNPPRNLMLLFVSDEENGGNQCLKAFLKSRYRRGITHAIVNEPTQLNIVTAHKGIFIFNIMFTGKSAHASRPDKGINAIENAAGFIIKAKSYGCRIAKRTYKSLSRPTVNIGCIAGGTKSNIVPSRCSIEVDRRVLPGSDERNAEKEMRQLLHKHTRLAKIETAYAAPSFTSDSCFPYTKIMKQGGATTSYTTVDFWTEAALLSRDNIKCVVCGPGSITRAHTANEYITETELSNAAQYYGTLFSRIQGG